MAGERAPHRERRRVRPARAGDAARRLVEPPRRLDLRRHRRDRAPVEARHPLRGPAPLQPLELRPRRLLPRARQGPGGSARLLVGADVRVARPRGVPDRGRRADDPLAAPPALHRRRVLADVRRGNRGARGERSLDDRPLAPGADLGVGLLVAARELAGDPRLPLLHDHGPPDDPARARGPAGLRGERRAARDAPHRADDDRVRDEGRRARRARARLPRPPAARASPARRRVPWRPGARVGVAHRPATQAARRDVRPRGGGRGRAGRARRDPGAAGRGHRRLATRQRADAGSHRRRRRRRLVERRPEDGAGDRTRRRPRSPGRSRTLFGSETRSEPRSPPQARGSRTSSAGSEPPPATPSQRPPTRSRTRGSRSLPGRGRGRRGSWSS